MRKKLAVLLLVAAPILAGCRGSAPAGDSTSGSGGATSPRAATESFLSAARTQDLQAMSLIWGTERGPARHTMHRQSLERREVVMMCHLRHDRYQIVEESALMNGQRRFTVDLTAGEITRRTSIVTVPARNGAWYVLSADLEPLRDLCASRQ